MYYTNLTTFVKRVDVLEHMQSVKICLSLVHTYFLYLCACVETLMRKKTALYIPRMSCFIPVFVQLRCSALWRL